MTASTLWALLGGAPWRKDSRELAVKHGLLGATCAAPQQTGRAPRNYFPAPAPPPWLPMLRVGSTPAARRTMTMPAFTLDLIFMRVKLASPRRARMSSKWMTPGFLIQQQTMNPTELGPCR